jgi:hypothetical protein
VDGTQSKLDEVQSKTGKPLGMLLVALGQVILIERNSP